MPRSILPAYDTTPAEAAGESPPVGDEREEAPPPRTVGSHGRLLLHFAATIPLEYLSLLSREENWSNSLLLNRLLRACFLPKYLKDLCTMLGHRGYLSNIGVIRTWLLFVAMALAGHVCGCGFFFVARRQALDGAALTWPEAYGLYAVETSITAEGQRHVALIMESTLTEAYVVSLYWAYITMITTGFGDIVPLNTGETAWCIFSMFVGVVITAMTIANLQRTIGQFDAARLTYQRKMELIEKFLRHRRLPADLQRRVTAFYDYQWQVLRGADEERLLRELPRSLQQRVANYMCRDIIAALPLLRGANRALLNVSARLREVTRLRGLLARARWLLPLPWLVPLPWLLLLPWLMLLLWRMLLPWLMLLLWRMLLPWLMRCRGHRCCRG